MKGKNKETSPIVTDGIKIIADSALSLIPVGGALISGVWDAVKSNAAQKRLKEWQTLVEARLSGLEITLQDIGSNEAFATALFHTTEAALKTSENQKRQYLANALRNSIDCDLDESRMMIFFNLLDRYTTLHLKILDYFSNPKKLCEKHGVAFFMGSPKDPLFAVYPDLKESEALVDKIVKELYYDGLMSTDNLNITMTSMGMIASRTTPLGSQFINFLLEE